MLAYLSRYTHRVAISNTRLITHDKRGVTFRYKDYRADGLARYKVTTLKTDEFIRRFMLHILPKGFHRIFHGRRENNGLVTLSWKPHIFPHTNCGSKMARARLCVPVDACRDQSHLVVPVRNKAAQAETLRMAFRLAK